MNLPRTSLIFAGITLALLSTSLSAQRTVYSTKWIVADSLDTPTGAPRTIKVRSGDVFLRHRLLPKAAAILDADLKDEAGKTILTKGSQMFALEVEGVDIFCDANQKSPSAMTALLVGGGFKNVCGVDSDRDGRFDSYFSARSLIKGLPSIEGKLPKVAKKSNNVVYRRVEPSTMTAQYFVGIEFEGKPLLYDRRNFRITFGEGNNHKSLSDWSYLKGGSYPQSMELLDSKFTLVSEKDGTLEIKIDREMPSQPFGVVMTVTYR
jgi:hypothetical protein